MSNETRTLHIKNMVCPRCIQAVKTILTDLGYSVRAIDLGWAEIAITDKPVDLPAIAKSLQNSGFELLQNREKQLVEQIKNTLLTYIYRLEKMDAPENASEFLGEKLGFSYAYLSKLFSQIEHVTIEKYLIHLKIERVKELLSYGELTLSEIAFRLQYSSSQHLSRQFKQITGITVSEFKSQPYVHRHSLDGLQFDA